MDAGHQTGERIHRLDLLARQGDLRTIMGNDTRDAELDMRSETIRRIAMEAAALMMFKGAGAARAISAAVAQHVSDMQGGRECRGTFAEVESTWIPPGREQEVREASAGILADVEKHLRDMMQQAGATIVRS